MITIRRADERGHTRLEWLDSRHTFSFGDYHDPRYMGFRALRVINDDRITPGAGFPTHAHSDMEILTYVLEGAVAHKDSTGSSSIISAGEAQRMSAGTGIRHSEYNASREAPAHFLQIWILPSTLGLEPSYEQRVVDKKPGHWVFVASGHPHAGAVTIHQDIEVLAAALASGQRVTYRVPERRHGWIHVASGGVHLNDTPLGGGDGASTGGGEIVEIAASSPAEVLLFDLA